MLNSAIDSFEFLQSALDHDRLVEVAHRRVNLANAEVVETPEGESGHFHHPEHGEGPPDLGGSERVLVVPHEALTHEIEIKRQQDVLGKYDAEVVYLIVVVTHSIGCHNK